MGMLLEAESGTHEQV
jgi:hypothetical protein